MRDLDRFRGCLLGGAAGDALGYTVEFMQEGRIFHRYGDRGITEYELTGGVAAISDDTQMTLFTAEGLLRGTAREPRGIRDSYTEDFHRAYLDWLKTQEERFPPKDGPSGSRLLTVPELFDLRAPGNTCLSALHSGECGTPEAPVNNSKGCGGVMRAAPPGLFFNDTGLAAEQVARIGAQAAAVTHGHILGWLPAAALAQIVHEISQNGDTVYDALMKTLYLQDEMWPASQAKDSFIALMNRAADLAATDKNSLDAVHMLGEGWVADEALAIAAYCALKYENDFDAALIAAVNHKGDSDSTGAVAGNILGARLGLSGIPAKYTEHLELRDLILETADSLHGFFAP